MAEQINYWARAWRFFLAGPIALLATLLVMAGGSLWLPAGEAEINHFVIPVVLLPAIWALLFFYSCLARLRNVSLVMAAIVVIHGAMIARHMLASGSA